MEQLLIILIILFTCLSLMGGVIVEFGVRFIKISGDSMHPTLKHGKYYIGITKHFNIKEGGIYIYHNQRGEPVIKRLLFKNRYNHELLYFTGDNSRVSIDSRHYGFISKENVIAKLLWF